MTPAPSGVGPAPDRPGRSRGAPVRLERLTKRYDDVVAVDDISLDIAAGEFVSLLGPSGSGKTTTLMMVAGFQDVTAGAITVGDREISRLPPHKRDIGVVFQHYALFPHMRVAENIGFPLRMRDVSKAESRRRVAEALRLVQLEDYGDRYPRQLSGGQQQRVALARAVVFEPGLALMDEPLGALDRQLREQMQFEIKRLQNTLGITVIYVTHDQEEALVMSDRIAVMNRGRVEQFAAPDELYNRPATAFVATFVGESNVIGGPRDGEPGGAVAMDSDEGHRLEGRAVDHLDAGSTGGGDDPAREDRRRRRRTTCRRVGRSSNAVPGHVRGGDVHRADEPLRRRHRSADNGSCCASRTGPAACRSRSGSDSRSPGTPRTCGCSPPAKTSPRSRRDRRTCLRWPCPSASRCRRIGATPAC